MKTQYLVCYDITSPKRLQRVCKLMKGQAIHIQYSVFSCLLTWRELEELKRALERRINPEEDDIRIYPLPAGEKIIVLGKAKRIPEGVTVVMP